MHTEDRDTCKTRRLPSGSTIALFCLIERPFIFFLLFFSLPRFRLLGLRHLISIHFHGRLDFAFPGFEATIIDGLIIDFVADISNTLFILMSKAKVVENLNNHILISTRLLADFPYR